MLVSINQNSGSAGSVPIEALRDSVASLAGIGGTAEEVLDRVSVIIAPFDGTEPSPFDGADGFWFFFSTENSWVLYAAIGGLFLFVVLLVLILLLLRKRRKKRLAEAQALQEEMEAAEMAEAIAFMTGEEAQPPTEGADIMEVNSEKSMELRQEVRKFVQNNPEIAAQMVKAWLKGEESGA